MAKVCPSNGHADKSEDSGMAERPTTQDSHARERLIGSRIASDGPGDDNVTRAAGIRSDLPNDRDKILAGIADQPFLRMAVRLERVLGMRLTAMRAPAAARTRATMRSSMPHASNGTSRSPRGYAFIPGAQEVVGRCQFHLCWRAPVQAANAAAWQRG